MQKNMSINVLVGQKMVNVKQTHSISCILNVLNHAIYVVKVKFVRLDGVFANPLENLFVTVKSYYFFKSNFNKTETPWASKSKL